MLWSWSGESLASHKARRVVVNSLSYIHGKPRHINVISMKIPKYFSLTLKKENIHNNLIFPRKSNTAPLHVCSLSSIGLGISLHFIGAEKMCHSNNH